MMQMTIAKLHLDLNQLSNTERYTVCHHVNTDHND